MADSYDNMMGSPQDPWDHPVDNIQAASNPQWAAPLAEALPAAPPPKTSRRSSKKK